MSNKVTIDGNECKVNAGFHAIDRFETLVGVPPDVAMEQGYKHDELTSAKVKAHWLHSCLSGKKKPSFEQFWEALDENPQLANEINNIIAGDTGEKKP